MMHRETNVHKTATQAFQWQCITLTLIAAFVIAVIIALLIVPTFLTAKNTPPTTQSVTIQETQFLYHHARRCVRHGVKLAPTEMVYLLSGEAEL